MPHSSRASLLPQEEAADIAGGARLAGSPLALQHLQPLPVAALLHLVWLCQHTKRPEPLGVGLTGHAQHTLRGRHDSAAAVRTQHAVAPTTTAVPGVRTGSRRQVFKVLYTCSLHGAAVSTPAPSRSLPPYLCVYVCCAGDGCDDDHPRAPQVAFCQVGDQCLVVLVLRALNIVDDACVSVWVWL